MCPPIRGRARAWVYGEVDTYPTSAAEPARETIDRLMPVTANLGLRWDHPREIAWAEGRLAVAAEQDDLSTRDRSDTQRIPPGGTPGYAVASIRGGWTITTQLSVVIAVENLTDEDYRIHGSGQNEAGRNLTLAYQWEF